MVELGAQHVQKDKMKRTALYYPTIAVPSGTWLRSALLYWDEVASIVPEDWEHRQLVPFTPEIDFLRKEEIFRPIRPDAFIMHGPWQRVDEFHKELRERIDSSTFQKHLMEGDRHLDARIHPDKVALNFFYDFLEPAGLARKDDSDSHWLLFERRTALLYMSCLAKYLAETDAEAVSPSTDLPIYERLSLDALRPQDGFACIDVELGKLLPIPRDEVALSDILEFRRRRRQELLSFRGIMDNFQTTLSRATNPAELKGAAVSIGENMEKGLNDLKAILDDGRVATIMGSIKAILSVKSPMLWATIGVTAGQARRVADLPLGWTGAGLALLGAIEISHHLIDSRNKKRASLRESPFAYAYHAQKEGIL